MTGNRIILLRSTNIFSDSRASKEITSYLKNDFNVIAIGWNRQLYDLSSKEINVNGNKAKIVLYNKKCNFAEGIKSIFKFLGFQLFIFRNLFKYRKEYDVIHCCDFDTSLLVRFFNFFARKKIIYDIYDYYVDSHNLGKLKKFFERMEIKMINKADLTIICSEQRVKQISKAHPKKLLVIHNSPNIEFEKKSVIKSKSKKIKIAYVGLLQDSRLLMEISKAFINHNEYELHIGGFGEYENYFKTLADKYGNIFFYGTMDYFDVLSLEVDCDILFATYDPKITNHRYSAPNKLYEAMALGKPIIVCNNTGIDEFVKENNIGVSIDYDGDEFIKAIDELVNNFDFDKVKNKCIKLYKNKYSWNVMEKKLIDSFEKK